MSLFPIKVEYPFKELFKSLNSVINYLPSIDSYATTILMLQKFINRL